MGALSQSESARGVAAFHNSMTLRMVIRLCRLRSTADSRSHNGSYLGDQGYRNMQNPKSTCDGSKARHHNVCDECSSQRIMTICDGSTPMPGFANGTLDPLNLLDPLEIVRVPWFCKGSSPKRARALILRGFKARYDHDNARVNASVINTP